MEPLPQTSRVVSMVLEQERHKEPAIGTGGSEESSGIVNAVGDKNRSYGRGRARGTCNFQGRGNQGKGRGNGKQCTYCSKPGHTVETYYKKHGYLLSFGRGNSCKQC